MKVVKNNSVYQLKDLEAGEVFLFYHEEDSYYWMKTSRLDFERASLPCLCVRVDNGETRWGDQNSSVIPINARVEVEE